LTQSYTCNAGACALSFGVLCGTFCVMLSATVVIPVYNGVGFLAACLGALGRQEGAECRVVAVDNASIDGSADLVAARFPEVVLLRNTRNEGFSRGVNTGIRYALGEGLAAHPVPGVVIVLNQDTEVAPGWLRALVDAFEADAEVGAVGCKIYEADGRSLQHVGGLLDEPRATTQLLGRGEVDCGQYDTPAERPYLSGAALGLRVAALEQVGLFDERFSPAYMEEVDLCWRLRAGGWRLRYTPRATLRHTEHGSPLPLGPRLSLSHRNRLRFVFKHYPPEHILRAFWPAERQALGHALGTPHHHALLRAYLDGLLLLDEFLLARRDMGLAPFSAVARREAGIMLRDLREDLGNLALLRQIDR